jgi:hypothetical protein
MENEDICFETILNFLSSSLNSSNLNEEDNYDNLKTYLERSKLDKDFFIKNRLDYFFLNTNKKNFVKLYERLYGYDFNLNHLLYCKKNNLKNSLNILKEFYKTDMRYEVSYYNDYLQQKNSITTLIK